MKLNSSITKKMLFVLVINLFYFQNFYGQDVKNDFWENVSYGGGFGLNFGDGFFSATLAPSAIYNVNEKFSFGLGLSATFNNQKSVYKSTILGGSLIALYNIIPEIQISSEFEQLNVNRRYNVNINNPDTNYWIPAMYFGVGYRNGNVTFGIRYDVLYNNEKSIYIDPWAPFVRFYF